MRAEKMLLENVFDQPIRVVSYHNPDVSNVLQFEAFLLAGMINTYGADFKTNWGYCSDSNGYWRFKRLHDVLESLEYEQLQVLTHPVWWQETAMLPRERIERCTQGRADYCLSGYDSDMKAFGRTNIGA